MLYNIGKYIKARRIELGISQEKLADGFCARNSISRIESGERVPKSDVLTTLLQRLGLSDSQIKILTDGEDVELAQVKFNVRQALILHDYTKARFILRQNEATISKLDPVSRRTFDIVDAIIRSSQNEISKEEALALFENLMRVIHPRYSPDNLPILLSYEEIILLNNIAFIYNDVGERETAITILYHVKEFYDSYVCDIEEALRTQPMILYNLSKLLGLAGRYDECIHICEEGIKLATETGKCANLATTYYNLAWALYYRNRSDDKERSLKYLKMAYYTVSVIDSKNLKRIDKYAQRLKEWFGETIVSL